VQTLKTTTRKWNSCHQLCYNVTIQVVTWRAILLVCSNFKRSRFLCI